MSLFGAIVKAFAKNAGNFASGLVGVPIAGDIVVDAWEGWHKDTDERKRKAELESYARQQMDEVVAEARALVQREARNWRGTACRARAVSGAGPASIRRSLRRPGRPHRPHRACRPGTAFGHDLLKFLPLKLPRFQPGDKPLANQRSGVVGIARPGWLW